MMARGSLFHRVRALRDSETGIAAIEFALIAPLLLFLLMGAITLFDIYRTRQTVEKASFVVADMISREVEVDDDELSLLYSIFTHLVPRTSEPPGMRLMSLQRGSAGWTTDWSYVMGTAPPDDSAARLASLPDTATGDSVVVLETEVKGMTIAETLGMSIVTHNLRSAVRPRFVSSIAKTD